MKNSDLGINVLQKYIISASRELGYRCIEDSPFIGSWCGRKLVPLYMEHAFKFESLRVQSVSEKIVRAECFFWNFVTSDQRIGDDEAVLDPFYSETNFVNYMLKVFVIWVFLSSSNEEKFICAIIFFLVNLLRSQKSSETFI